MHFHLDWTLKPQHVARKTLAQAPVQLGVAGLPNLVANVNALEVDVTPAEGK
jgi:hypothetical protein